MALNLWHTQTQCIKAWGRHVHPIQEQTVPAQGPEPTHTVCQWSVESKRTTAVKGCAVDRLTDSSIRWWGLAADNHNTAQSPTAKLKLAPVCTPSRAKHMHACPSGPLPKLPRYTTQHTSRCLYPSKTTPHTRLLLKEPSRQLHHHPWNTQLSKTTTTCLEPTTSTAAATSRLGLPRASCTAQALRPPEAMNRRPFMAS